MKKEVEKSSTKTKIKQSSPEAKTELKVEGNFFFKMESGSVNDNKYIQ